MINDTGGAIWTGGNRGLLHVLDTAIQAAAPSPQSLIVVNHDVQSGTIEFNFAVPKGASGETFFYQSRLDGAETTWSVPSTESRRTFGGLGHANYRFDVRVLDRFGRAGPISSHAFTILAPWWKTVPAFLAYGGSLILLVTAVARWQVLRLRRQNELLNRLVKTRTHEIELVSTAKSEFLNNVSHEIRNPLNGLTGLLALLKEDRLDARERHLARSLKSVAATLTQVFEDVLQFSKLEYGYGQLDRRTFALKPLLAEVVALFAVQAEQAGCTLAVRWPASLVDGFQGDPVKIKTIVSNFVGNALKYAPRAPVEIRVESTGETDGMVDLYLDVVDRGPGIPTDEQELIFKKFVRGRRAGADKIPGTGLGLATCQMLAKLMNGSVGVESIPGQGATFHLKLLLARAELAAELEASVDVDGGADVSEQRVLIVDDEAYNRVVLEGIALELGVLSDSAGTAAEALRHLAATNYTVVFLDWELPDANGGAIARAVNAQSNGQRPIILATTAHDSDEMRQRCRDAGMDGFLLKPYDAAKISRAIGEMQTNRAHHGSAPNVFWCDVVTPDSELDLGAFDYFNRARPNSPKAARQLYVQAIKDQVAILDEAVTTGRIEVISMAAHRLRALSGIVRATDLNRAATQLEELACVGTADKCSAAWASTRRACDALCERLT
jgi:signal transduction histidine kinase/DNA-binding response OmpR family regulator